MNKYILYIGSFTPFMFLIILRGTGNFDGLYGQDPYEYYRYSNALREFLVHGTAPGDYFWPIGYPLAGALLSLAVPDLSLCLQLISCLSLSIVFIYSIKVIQLIYSIKQINAAAFAGLFIILSPFMLRFSLSVMADLFTLATLVMGTYFMFRFIKNNSISSISLGVFLFSISLMSRYAAGIIMLPIACYVVYTFLKSKQKWYFIPMLLVIASIPFIPHFLIRGENSTHFIFHDWVTYWSPANFIQKRFTTRDGTTSYTTPNILYSLLGLFHPRYFFAGIIISFIGFKKFTWSKETKILLISIVLYLLFLAGIPYQNNRFLLLAFPFLIILYYPAIKYCMQLLGRKWKMVAACCIILVQLGFFVLSFKIVYDRTQLEKEIYTFILNTQPTAIYTMDIDISLKGRGYSAVIYNIYNQYYQQVDKKAVVIFNTQIFPQQWQGKTPMDNWNNFNDHYHLEGSKNI